MTVQEGFADAGAVPVREAPGSQAWWRSRSSDELQTIVHRGALAGDIFFAAAAEMERRANELEAARDAQQVKAVKTSRRLGWELKLLFGVVTVGLLAVLLMLLR